MKTATALMLTVALVASPTFSQKFLGPGSLGTGNFSPILRVSKPNAGDPGFNISVSLGMGGASGILVLSPNATNVLMGGLPIYVDLATALTPFLPIVLDGPLGVPGAGSFTLPASLAGIPGTSVAGLSFAIQAALAEPGQVVVTNGVLATLQMEPSIAVASSVAGTADPFALIDPLAPSTVFQGAATETNNVNGVAYADNGRTLYVLSNGNTIVRRDMTVPAPSPWTLVMPLVNANGVAEGNIQHDPCDQLLWFLADIGSGFQFHALDVNPLSPTFEQVLYSTTNVGTNLVGTWALSPSGDRICLPELFNGGIRVWDTEPTSPTFLQNVDLWQPPIPIPLPSSLIPSGGVSGFWVNSKVTFSATEQEIFVLRQGTGAIPAEIAVYSFTLQGWMDYDPNTPGVDNIGPQANPPIILGSAPVSLSVAPGTTSLFVSGFGGTGFAGRIDNPLLVGGVSYTPVTGFSLVNAWRSTISPNGDRVAIASGAPFELRILDLNTLAVQATLPLGMSDATNIVWH